MNDVLDECSSRWRALHKNQATTGSKSEPKQKPLLTPNRGLPARGQQQAENSNEEPSDVVVLVTNLRLSCNRHIDEAASWLQSIVRTYP